MESIFRLFKVESVVKFPIKLSNTASLLNEQLRIEPNIEMGKGEEGDKQRNTKTGKSNTPNDKKNHNNKKMQQKL